MVTLPASPYIEHRWQSYYIAGTRVTLDSVAWGLRRGQKLEEILDDFPAIQNRDVLAGAIAFIQAHPQEINAYLEEGEKIWEELRRRNAPEVLEAMRRYEEERDRKLA